jgi:predicted short-subunit dehydrogenase-like oxidoreductase (DUF2520 family)
MKTIGFIGAGNVCWHLVKIFSEKGFDCKIFSRNPEKTERNFADITTPFSIFSIDDRALKDCEIVFITAGDSQIESIAKQNLSGYTGIVVHSSGATSMDVLSQFAQYAVVYPFQTFNMGMPLSATEFPVFIEANSETTRNTLQQWLEQIFTSVKHLDSESRKKLHIAGVMANNFVNALFNAANQLVKEIDLPKETIKPLVQETMTKYFTDASAWSHQTGPAKRRDYNTIGDHVNFLRVEQPSLEEIYSTLTRFIINNTEVSND